MEIGWKIFQKSLLNIYNNFDDALRLSGGVFIIAIFVSTAVNVFLTGGLMPPNLAQYQIDPTNPEPVMIPPNELLAIFTNGLLLFGAFSWIAVAWHRYVLMAEVNTNLLPVWNTTRVLSYIGRSLLLGLALGLLLALPLGFLAVLLSVVGLASIVPLIAIVAVYYMLMRLGLILPAAALDKSLKFAESFHASRPMGGPILALAFLQVIFFLFLSVLTGLLAPDNLLGVLVSAITQWIAVLVSASILTTLYVHLMLGQKLD